MDIVVFRLWQGKWGSIKSGGWSPKVRTSIIHLQQKIKISAHLTSNVSVMVDGILPEGFLPLIFFIILDYMYMYETCIYWQILQFLYVYMYILLDYKSRLIYCTLTWYEYLLFVLKTSQADNGHWRNQDEGGPVVCGRCKQ